jgi:four helix bundle protein
MSGSYRELMVWQQSMQLVKQIYETTRAFPRDEIYGLTSQIRRAAVSVPSNIAEGQGRESRPEFYQFLSKARGSLMEVETQILIAFELGYLGSAKSDELVALTSRTGQLINGLMRSLKTRIRAT